MSNLGQYRWCLQYVSVDIELFAVHILLPTVRFVQLVVDYELYAAVVAVVIILIAIEVVVCWWSWWYFL